MQMEIKSIISYLFLLQALLSILTLAMAVSPRDIRVFRCNSDKKTNLTNNYMDNIRSSLGAVAKNIGANNGFYHSSAGRKADELVNAIGLCAGHLQQYFCELCVDKSMQALMTYCGTLEKEGVGWDPNCMVRYSYRKIIGVLDESFSVHLPENITVARPSEMDKALYDLITRLQKEAAGGSSIKKYAYGNITYASNSSLYAVMQCTPDLSKEQCSKCLDSIVLTVHSCCSGKVAARMLSPNCYLRYDIVKFDRT